MAWWPKALNIVRKRQLFGLFVIVGTLAVVLGIGSVAFRVADRVEDQSRLSTWLLSHFASLHMAQNSSSGLSDVMEKARELEVPFIVTNPRGQPMVWSSQIIGIPIPDQQLTLLAVDPAGGNSPEIDRILELIVEYDRLNEPFAIINPETGTRYLTLHYGPSVLGRQIRWLPWVELALLGVFFLAVVWTLSVKRDGEEQRLFAGMAKETAHQLGTPITSILGWVEILRDRHTNDDIVEELDKDVQRLGKVSERFSKIGSRPKREDVDIWGTIESSVAYFERRLPQLGGRVDLRAERHTDLTCRFNRDLMEWVLENLIKNGIDAMKDRSGAILVTMSAGPGNMLELRVADDGAGISSGKRNRIFEPGFTTKSRGWGMGLALVKRIIVQYHRGRIIVEKTGNEGTTFLISLPAEETDRGV